jgi:hypothetical protein
MPTDHSKLQHVGPKAVALCKHLDGPASSADQICRMGFAAPVAIEIARQMKAGIGDKRILFESCGFSTPDAATFAAFITARGSI